MQRGQVFRQNGSWYLRYYQYEIKDGRAVRRRRVRQGLARYSDEYRSKKDVLPLVDPILSPINTGLVQPGSSLTIAQFVEKCYFPGREKKLRPSTLNGYREIFKNHIETTVGGIRHARLSYKGRAAFSRCDGGEGTKSEESGENPVPVIPILRRALDQHRTCHPGDGCIFAGDRRRAALNLDNLSRRVLSPKLDGGWKG